MKHIVTTVALSGFLFATALPTLPRNASAASFDCDRPDLAADEKVICDTRALNDDDVKMVTTFELLSGLLAMGSRGAMQDEQVEWLKRRHACGGDADCIRAAYQERLKQFDEVYNNLNRPL
ncbi:uncharacterized protein J2046_002827 [Rhizobium petrolearium]|uniref:lysozyme inhibitor LprI family protein n=1 Tax=Neorhizobium petrolearium TaxID=515361 RepID=UPI001F2D9592|nr:hypothetical protein [Neorhizobium petrolearium]MBP1844568.1 uncharacterized protein [Neorhizobium petrolearium]